MVEIWTATGSRAGDGAAMATQAEANGFDGISFGDTQCLAADPFVALAVAAGVTEQIRLGIRVTNPTTRHPSVTACAATTLQAESGARAVLGVGRGDSSLAHLGLPAATVDELERFLVALQGYLRGDAVESNGVDSRLRWLPPELPKVPVDVAATGPAVISVGARHADALSFNVGADPDRLRRAIDLARRVRADSAMAAEPLSFGAYVNVVAHPDRRTALDLGKGPVAAYAHFSGMPGHPVDELPPADAAAIKAMSDDYDVSQHARSRARHVAHLDDEFIGRFGVIGTPEECVRRLADLVGLGLDRLLIVGAAPDAPADQAVEARRLLVTQVIPGLRAAVA